MKTSVLCAGPSNPHAGWVAIDELAQLLAYYFKAELLSPRRTSGGWLARQIRPHKEHYEPLHTSGGDVLIVVAHGPSDLGLINAIPNCRKKFNKIYGFVTDSYFHAGYVKETAQYDAITVTAHEDVSFPLTRYRIPVYQLYQGVDCLTWIPRALKQREIDIMGFGRTPPSYQTCFAQRFHRASSPHLYLHSPLGNLAGPSVHLERGMLFKLLQRSRISLAFHLLVEPQGNRPRSMMVTSRWLESLLSGCIVAGRRPVSRMADDMLCWPGATVELSNDPQTAADELEDLLARNDELEAQRRINICQTASLHDWRYRIGALCGLLDLPIPATLGEDVERLQAMCAAYESVV